MLKQGLLGSEVLAMLSVHKDVNVQLASGVVNNHYLTNFHQQRTGNCVPYFYPQTAPNIPVTLVYKTVDVPNIINSSIPGVLLEYLFNTIGDNGRIVLDSNILMGFIEERLEDSLVKIKFEENKPSFNIVFVKNDIKDIVENDKTPYPYEIELSYTDGKPFTTKEVSDVYKIIDDIFSTLLYKEYLHLKSLK